MGNIENAFRLAPRVDFLPEDVANHSELNTALPIGFGQTNSQPETVELMLEWLAIEPGNKVLDVGSGSGWTGALMSYLTGSAGKVYAVEIIPELVEFGRDNCQRRGIKNVEFHQAGKVYGLPSKAPYDRILVSASATELPQELLDQLKIGGKMVIPVHDEILEIEKTAAGKYQTTAHPWFVFVPLVRPHRRSSL